MTKLLFVDTNIYLDFYRIRTDVNTDFLGHMEAIKDRLIVTDQVEMEYKKNRQKAILEGMNELKPPTKISVPSVLRQDRLSEGLDRNIEDIKKKVGKLKTRPANEKIQQDMTWCTKCSKGSSPRRRILICIASLRSGTRSGIWLRKDIYRAIHPEKRKTRA